MVVMVQVVFAQLPPPPQPPTYTIKNLGTLCTPHPDFGCEGAESFALDVNNMGQVVGGSSVVRGIGIFLHYVLVPFRTSAGQPINPSTDQLDSSISQGIAYAINDGSEVVGSGAFVGYFSEAFVVLGSGPPAVLPAPHTCQFVIPPPPIPPPPLFPCNAAYGINDGGTVVGSIATDPLPSNWLAARWTSVLQDLDPLGSSSAAYDINDSGLTAGIARVGFNDHAAVFGGLSPVSLGTLGGSECTSCDSVAYGVNNGGAPDPTTPTTAQIVGRSDLTPTGLHHAFVFQFGPGLGMQDLGTLCAEGDCHSAAFDINDHGHIVGQSETVPTSGTTRAFLYRNSQMTDLNGLLGPADQAQWDLFEARAINEFGQIAGTGRFQGQTRAFLMTPPLSVIFDNVSLLASLALSSQPSGTRQSLLATLLAAEAAIERNQHEVAGVQLNAYEQQVRALAERRQLTEIQQTKLLAGAALILRVLEEEGRR
jgi:probable HAF family extracellular repeat protein